MAAQIDIIVGRIEALACDAVVNAANARLLPGSGVDGALRAAAGPALTKLTATMAPLLRSQAVITPGFNAPAKFIIHIAAPIWHEPGDKQEKILELGRSYFNAVKLAHAHKLTSIAFPCIGTGIYGWPTDVACDVALSHVDSALEATSIERVIYCCFSETDAALYAAGRRGELR
jgi:O-acetyl-ADP-ribose deacetylase (regulator of RNase III)